MDGIDSRPLIFEEVVGQDAASMLLSNAIKDSKYSRAYLFAGPRSIGKTTLAKIFARAALCSNRNPETHDPCNECESCLSFLNDNHQAYIEEDAARYSTKENMTTLLDILSFEVAGKRIILLDEAHRISEAGKDTILKTLERPVSEDDTIFLFATSEIQKMPTTLKSRCTRVPLTLPSPKHVLAKLESVCTKNEVKYDHRALTSLAEWSGGHFREAENALEPLELMGGITYENVAVYTSFDQDAVSEMLISLNSNLVQALEQVESLCHRFGADNVQSSMLRVLLEALQFGLSGMIRETHESIKQVYQCYGNKLGKILAHFSSKGKFEDSRLLQTELVQTYYLIIKGDFSAPATSAPQNSTISAADVASAGKGDNEPPKDKLAAQREMKLRARGKHIVTKTEDTLAKTWGEEEVNKSVTLRRT